MIQKLDLILTSDNVVEKFKSNYANNSNFKKWILNLLPEVEDCNNQKQDNPWHIYDCLTHILHSVNNINKQTKDLEFNKRRMLAYCMFLHDIGKPAKHIRRFSKAYNRDVDSFFDHNVKSAEIAKRVLPKLNFTKTEIDIMEKLILKHDIFMFITLNKTDNPHHRVLNYQLLMQEIRELNLVGNGKILLQYLILMGRADNLSQNPKLTQDSLKMLSKMEEMLSGVKVN